jgi:hypothetical protein
VDFSALKSTWAGGRAKSGRSCFFTNEPPLPYLEFSNPPIKGNTRPRSIPLDKIRKKSKKIKNFEFFFFENFNYLFFFKKASTFCYRLDNEVLFDFVRFVPVTNSTFMSFFSRIGTTT